MVRVKLVKFYVYHTIKAVKILNMSLIQIQLNKESSKNYNTKL